MNNNLQEEFKKELFGSLEDINKSLTENVPLSDDELSLLLLSSILEEEG